MKLRLLLGIVFFGLMSCSGDDSSETVNINDPVTETPTDSVPATDSVPPANAEKHLKSISTYYPGNSESSFFITFENDRPIAFFKRNESGELVYTQKNYYQYNLLFYTEYYDDMGVLNRRQYIEYDDQNRIIEVKTESYNLFTSVSSNNFTYNSNNTITNNTDLGGIYYETMYLNNNDQIFKIEQNYAYPGYQKQFEQVLYQGNNIVSHVLSDNFGDVYTRTYEYSNELVVKGDFLKYHLNTFGSNANMILFGQSFYTALETGDNYIVSENTQNSTQTFYNYVYEFDNDGYPIKRKNVGSNGVVYQYEVIEYQ